MKRCIMFDSAAALWMERPARIGFIRRPDFLFFFPSFAFEEFCVNIGFFLFFYENTKRGLHTWSLNRILTWRFIVAINVFSRNV